MRRVAEIIYIVPEERKAFIDNALNPDKEELEVLWMCGVRRQQYFSMSDYLIMTFEYDGEDFAADMSKMAQYLDSKGRLIKKRRKDVPLDQFKKMNWWAPMKRLGTLLDTDPTEGKVDGRRSVFEKMMDGSMDEYSDISFDEGEWINDMQI